RIAAFVLAIVVLAPGVSLAQPVASATDTVRATPAGSSCASPRHMSAGHCCGGGEEWVEARTRCVCLDPAACGPGTTPQTGTPAGAQFSLRPDLRTLSPRGGDEGAVFSLRCGPTEVA